MKIYRDNFEKAYIEATEAFYKTKAPEYLAANGVQNYMKYADGKLKEEEQRAMRYLETRKGCNSVAAVSTHTRICSCHNQYPSLVGRGIPAKPLHNYDTFSVHFNYFYCMEICNKLRRDLAMFTYIYLNVDEC